MSWLAEMEFQRKADEGERLGWRAGRFQRNNDLSLHGMNRLGGAEMTEVSGVVMTAAPTNRGIQELGLFPQRRQNWFLTG